MDVWIKNGGEKKGTLSYLSLPVCRLLCEQAGFRTRWDPDERALHLTSGWQGKKVYLVSAQKDDTLSAILANIETFLGATGANLIRLSPNTSPSGEGEICLQITGQPEKSAQLPKFHILHSPGPRGKEWAQAFHRELKTNGFNARIKAHSKRHFPVPFVELRCHLPAANESDKKQLQESLALILASALLRGLTKGNLLALLPYLSAETLQLILPIAADNIQKTEPADQKPVQAESASKTTRTVTEIKSDQTVAATVEPASFTPQLQAEVYFDHQVLVPGSEDDPFLILGQMYIKNTGTRDLINPVICLRTTPANGIQLKGQIVPPKMVDTLAVQSFGGGSVGWRYLEDDWFKKAKERGEYWVCPIQPLRIPPGETETFSNFQISIPKPENGGTITVQGMVFLKDENLQIPSNNQMTISFL